RVTRRVALSSATTCTVAFTSLKSWAWVGVCFCATAPEADFDSLAQPASPIRTPRTTAGTATDGWRRASMGCYLREGERDSSPRAPRGATTAAPGRSSEDLGHLLGGVVRIHVVPGLLALGQLDLLAGHVLVADAAQQVADAVQPRALLVVRVHHEPRRPGCVG